MKPTLNEEIGMSRQGINYVNSLEVKEYAEVPKTPIRNTNFMLNEDIEMKALYNNIPEEMERIRIRKQARNAWICIFVIILITVIVNWKS